THLALERPEMGAAQPRVLEYAVHGQEAGCPGAGLVLVPTSDERDAKRRAILCHTSQLTLRRKGLFAFADRPERFTAASEPRLARLGGPLRLVEAWPGQCRFALRPSPRIALGRTELLVVSNPEVDATTLRVPIACWPSSRELRDKTGEVLGYATTIRAGRELHITVTAPLLRARGPCFAKLDVTRQR